MSKRVVESIGQHTAGEPAMAIVFAQPAHHGGRIDE
jgi:hypothetical protein